jgi:glutamate dehydrogenase
MSDIVEPAGSRIRQDSSTIEAACQEVRRLASPAEVEPAATFTAAFLAKAPVDLIRARSPEALARMALGTLGFVRGTRPDEVDVEVKNREPDDEGWHAPVTVVRTSVTERPFIVDTIREFLHAQGLVIEAIVYPVLHVDRDDRGQVVGVRPFREGESHESLVHCEVTEIADPEARRALAEELERRLVDVVRATDDFPLMVDALDVVVQELSERSETVSDRSEEIAEILDFLHWLRDGGFVFLGYRGYDLTPRDGGRYITVTRGSGLGVLRDEATSSYARPVSIDELEKGQRDIVERGPLLIISKTNAESTVHRRARMDYIGVRKIGPEGQAVGEHRFLGLFTSRAYSETAEDIPILRRKLRAILERSEAKEGSHDHKEIITIFNSLPKEELFLASAEEVGSEIRIVLTSYHTAGVRVTLRRDPLHRGATVMVILPKDRFSGDVRKAIEEALVSMFDAELLNYHLTLGAGDQARFHFYLGASPEQLEDTDVSALEQMVRRIIRSWTDRVREELAKARSAEDARHLTERFGQAFGAEYRAATPPEEAAKDVLELEGMVAEDRAVSITLANRGTSAAAPDFGEVTELKVFSRGERLVLSDFMPILENMGLRVIGVAPFEVREADGITTIHAFAVQDADGRPLDVESRGSALAEAILAVRDGDARNDLMNQLVLTAGLRWREVDVFRAYAGYAFQVRAVPSRMALPVALVHNPGVARELFDLFETLFDPAKEVELGERDMISTDIRAAFHGSLRAVGALAADRALRHLERLITGTVRTNYYQGGGAEPHGRSGGVPYISFKFACRQIEVLKQTRLLYEVWVHSARMEGVHLRGGRVARGGIRWSDRPDDFRTEILGLVKTQVVKNAVIVPSGSKGGFITVKQPDDPEARFEEGRRQYRTLVRGLLDLTDNLDADGRTIPPNAVVCRDDPDPYLVVAADKGTATFSDTANAISGEYGFWLGDAFASGGSNGYDHKDVGITARGAWECVRRHFREKGKDIQSEPFTVVGVGDMSGDVFGNGMLLSRQIRLIAAFDHRHVFIDPDPDPEATYVERERVFALGRSSWEDYDRSLLSEGGLVVPRGAKEVELSPEARRALGLAEDAPAVMDGEQLVRAVLCSPVELLWNGGIGTYVKADSETHADAGDPSNDAVRVDASDLRCEVIGEGGNLGLTQAARVAFALSGGRINTDALDNSGGVDLSDHEVNLKILLAVPVSRGLLGEDERNRLLEELTEDVAELVLANNRTQSLAVTLDRLRAAESAEEFRHLMVTLERTGELDRASEGLPSTDDLVERADAGYGLTRPELCVLLAYAKLALKARILKSDVPDDPVTASYLLGYFPPRAVAAAGQEALEGHRLRREIVTGQLTSELVDLMGATFIHRLVRDTGRTAAEVVQAWLVASRLAEHSTLLAEMAKQQSALDAAVTARWLMGLARVLERGTRWVLQNVDPDTSPALVVDRNVQGLVTIRERFGDLVAGEERALFLDRVHEIRQLGADEAFSRNLITLRFLDQLLEILKVSREMDTDGVATGLAYYRVSETFEVPWLRRLAFAEAGEGPWDLRAAQALSGDLSRVHRKLVTAVLAGGKGAVDVEKRLERLLSERPRDLERFREVVAELRSEDEAGLAAASVAIRELAAFAERASSTGA